MGHLRIFPEFRIFFFTSVEKKNLSPASWLFFCLGKIGGIIRHYCRPAFKYKISRSIRISRFHVWKSQDFVLFRNWKKKKASHFVACLQAHKAWAKNKFYDRLNWTALAEPFAHCDSASEVDLASPISNMMPLFRRSGNSAVFEGSSHFSSVCNDLGRENRESAKSEIII